jgi:hypothetical protein
MSLLTENDLKEREREKILFDEKTEKHFDGKI